MVFCATGFVWLRTLPSQSCALAAEFGNTAQTYNTVLTLGSRPRGCYQVLRRRRRLPCVQAGLPRSAPEVLKPEHGAIVGVALRFQDVGLHRWPHDAQGIGTKPAWAPVYVFLVPILPGSPWPSH